MAKDPEVETEGQAAEEGDAQQSEDDTQLEEERGGRR